MQYYLKEFQIPEMTAELIFKYLQGMLTADVHYCTLFSNLINVEKLFSTMVLLLGHCAKKLAVPTTQETGIDRLLGANG